MTYKEQLQRPEWKLKRKAILERDNHECKFCGDSNNLHVHHKYYLNNTLAWNYPNEALITLCKDCHEIEEKMFKELSATFFMDLRKVGFDAFMMNQFVKALQIIAKDSPATGFEICELIWNLAALPLNDRLAVAHIVERLWYRPSEVNFKSRKEWLINNG